jgi:hypothetical protein
LRIMSLNNTTDAVFFQVIFSLLSRFYLSALLEIYRAYCNDHPEHKQ